jgi:TrmH family RNA methyltransferase
MELVTSPANPLLRDLRRAVSRGELTAEGLWVAEGFHLLEEALRSDCAVPVVLASESVRATVERHVAGLASVRTVVLPDRLFQTVAATETSQGVIALSRPPQWRIEQIFRGQSMVIVVDGLQDPGNAGAIVRAAEAFGATGIMFLKGSASPFHPKTLRASAGSLFRVPFIAGVEVALAAAALRQHRLDIYTAMPYTGSERLAEDVDFSRRCALVIGNEGRGVSDELRFIAQDIAIPTLGVESLNAAVAASVLLYETRRQRVREAARV